MILSPRQTFELEIQRQAMMKSSDPAGQHELEVLISGEWYALVHGRGKYLHYVLLNIVVLSVH